MIVPRNFFSSPTLDVAKQLLGCVATHYTSAGVAAGKIVEVEAYLYPTDAAAHTYHGLSARNKIMFGPGGHLYVYLSYGIHACMNVVTDSPGEGILIRAIEPVAGIELMQQRRGVSKLQNLGSGPGKVTQALGITLEDDGLAINKGSFELHLPEVPVSADQITQTQRVGITKAAELPYRFYLSDSQFVSRR